MPFLFACLSFSLKRFQEIISKSMAPKIFNSKYEQCCLSSYLLSKNVLKIMYQYTFSLKILGANLSLTVRMYERSPPLNNWRYVTITYDPETSTNTWENRANKKRSLYPNWWNQGWWRFAKVTVEGNCHKLRRSLLKELLLLMTYK